MNAHSSVAVPLDTLAAQINAQLEKVKQYDGKAEEFRIAAGLQLIEARKRIDAGETNVGWLAWCRANIKRSRVDIYKVMRIASSSDPVGAVEHERAEARERMARSRDVANVRNIEEEPEDDTETPLIENDPRAPLVSAPDPGLYGVMMNSWEQCLAAFRKATPAQRAEFRRNTKRHSKDLVSFMS